MNHRYEIVKIDNYEQLMPYSEYTEWCICFTPLALEYYSDGGKKRLFILIRDDMPQVRMAKGASFPKDKYGLSLIALFVDDKGNFETTSRWNSFDEPPQLLSREELQGMLTRKQYETIFTNQQVQ